MVYIITYEMGYNFQKESGIGGQMARTACVSKFRSKNTLNIV